MKTFEVYSHPTHGYEAVKEGFSWPAFFFTWIWAFIKGLTVHGFATIGVWIVFFGLEKYFEQARNQDAQMGMLALQLGLCALLGLLGNTWSVTLLKKRGFQHIKTLEAPTPQAAIAAVTNSAEIAALQPSPPANNANIEVYVQQTGMPSFSDIEAVARGTKTTVSITLTCGACGEDWKEAVIPNKETRLTCPHCGAVNRYKLDAKAFGL